MKEIKCPNCDGKEMTLIKSNMKDNELKYIYLCRGCKQSFAVNMEVSDKEEPPPKK